MEGHGGGEPMGMLAPLSRPLRRAVSRRGAGP